MFRGSLFGPKDCRNRERKVWERFESLESILVWGCARIERVRNGERWYEVEIALPQGREWKTYLDDPF